MDRAEKILVCYNEPVSYYENYLGKDSDSPVKIDLSEKGFSEHIEHIKESLRKNFKEVRSFGVTDNILSLYNELKFFTPDVVLNFIEAVEGNAYFESYSAGFFDVMEISYTGNTALTLGNCLIKERTKRILQGNGIKTPDYMLIENTEQVRGKNFPLKFPLIVKLSSEDASIGISEFSVVKNFKELKKRIDYLFKNYSQPVIAEEFIDGREINVSILGNEVLPLSEIDFSELPANYPKIITYEAKWAPDSDYYKYTKPVCPAKVDGNVKAKIEETAMSAFKALGCRDYARVDMRLAKRNVPYVIEVNPNPDISIDSGFVRSAEAAGINYNLLLDKIVGFADRRRWEYD